MDKLLSQWMKDIDGSRKLFSLSLCGTHDSATQYVQLSKYARCQKDDIYNQLMLGARAIDIRVEPKKDRLVLVHGAANIYNEKSKNTLMYLDKVLEMCYKFLEEHPSETVVFQFKNDSNRKNEKSFNNLFYGYIKGNEDKWYLKSTAPTLEEARGKLVLIRRCRIDGSNPDYNSDNTGIDFSSWVEQDKKLPYALVLKTNAGDNAEFLIQDRFKYAPEQRWNDCIKPFLDERKAFKGQYVICYLSTAGGMKGPLENSKIINRHFLSYRLNPNAYYGIMYFDFLSEELSRKVIEHNFINK